MKKSFFGLLLGTLLLLTSCAVYVTPDTVAVSGRVRFGIEVSDVIRVFEPTRGADSTYYAGENVAFRVLSTRDGYLTLTALDPDGRVNVFASNIYVYGGQTVVVSGPDDNTVFTLQPPRGLQRVRASFTPSPTHGRSNFRDLNGESQWTQSIVTEVSDYDVRDIAETQFYLQ